MPYENIAGAMLDAAYQAERQDKLRRAYAAYQVLLDK
jgi:hypothetical protein